MAKKKEENTNASVLDDLIESEFSDMEDLSKVDSAVPYWIDSGNWALNYAMSKKFRGGYPGGRISNLWGQSGTGKSMLPATASKAKNWNNMNLDLFDRIIVIDSEGGGTGKSLFSFVGAPMEKVRYVKINTLDSYRISNSDPSKMEAVKDEEVPSKLETSTYTYKRGLLCFIKKLIYALQYSKTKERVLIIVDSISNIKSFRVAVEGGEDMGKTNKLLNNLFNLDNNINEVGASMLLVSKVYTNLNNPYDPWVMSGGQSVMFNPSVNLKLTVMSDGSDITDAQMKEEKLRRKSALGNSMKVIRATVTKSRFGTENRNVWVLLDATYGLVKNSGLFDLLVDFGACKKNGTRYTVPGVIVDEKGNDISFFKKDFLSIFGKKENEYIDKLQVIMEKIEEDIKNKRMNIDVNDIDEYNEEVDADADDTAESSVSDMLKQMEVEKEMDAEKEMEEKNE